MLSYLISSHLISSHLISPHLISSHRISPRLFYPHLSSSQIREKQSELLQQLQTLETAAHRDLVTELSKFSVFESSLAANHRYDTQVKICSAHLFSAYRILSWFHLISYSLLVSSHRFCPPRFSSFLFPSLLSSSLRFSVAFVGGGERCGCRGGRGP